MTTDRQRTEAAAQFGYQHDEGSFLGGCAGIGGTTVGTDSAYIANSDTRLVVTTAVGADTPEWTAGLNHTIEAYQIVIAYSRESALKMPGIDIGSGDYSPGRCSRAVNDDFSDVSHNIAESPRQGNVSMSATLQN